MGRSLYLSNLVGLYPQMLINNLPLCTLENGRISGIRGESAVLDPNHTSQLSGGLSGSRKAMPEDAPSRG